MKPTPLLDLLYYIFVLGAAIVGIYKSWIQYMVAQQPPERRDGPDIGGDFDIA